MGVAVSSLSLPLFPPHTLPLLQCGVPSTGDSSSQTAPAWVLPTGCSPSGTGCSSVGPPRGHKPCQQTCSGAGSSLSTGPQALPGACSSAGSPRGHSPIWAPTCSGVGSSRGCGWRSAPPRASLGCRGTACLTTGCSTGCCRGTSAPAPGAPPPPPSLILMFVDLFLSHHVTLPLAATV